MSTIMDGINNMQAMTNQINQLNAMKKDGVQDPKAIQYVLGQNFNQMLDKLISATDSKDDENRDSTFLPSSYLPTNNRVYVENLLKQNGVDGTSPVDINNLLINNNSLSDPTYLSSLSQLENNVLALDSFL